jgi:hypothetical protein
LKRSRLLPTLATALALSVGLSCQLLVGLDGLTNGQCPSGQKPCNGTCVSNSSTTYGCGSADCAPCVLTNVADFICDRNKACAPSQCVPDYKTCPNDQAHPGTCQIDTAHDANNCSDCGVHCQVPANGIAGCAGGVCAIKSCNPPYDDCDHDPDNGCETDLSADPLNCGACRHACPAGAGCSAGHCMPVDASGD